MTQYVSFNISIFRLLIKKLQTKTLTWIIHDKNPQANNKYFVFHLISENIWRFCLVFVQIVSAPTPKNPFCVTAYNATRV